MSNANASKFAVPASEHDDNEVPFSVLGPIYADKDELTAKGTRFDIVSITEEQGAFGPRWVVSIDREDCDGDELITMGKNERRDQEMQNALTYLAKHKTIPNVRLRKIGKAYVFTTAE